MCVTLRITWQQPNTSFPITLLCSQYTTPWQTVRLEMPQHCGHNSARRLWNPKIHHLVHNSPHIVHILIRTNPSHTTTPHLKSILILSSNVSIMPPKWSLAFVFSGWNSVRIAHQSKRAACPTHPTLLDFSIILSLSLQTITLVITQSSVSFCYVIPHRS